jgi:UDP-glucose 4-epimerase
MRKALVTGGAGFIGSHVADLFLAKGWGVTVVDDLSSGKRENLPDTAEFHEISVNSPEFSRLAGSGNFDVVAHLAAQMDVRKSVADPVADAATNILGTLNLMEALRKNASSARVVFTSTGGALYGDLAMPPNFETSAKNPDSPYGVGKLSIEYYLAYYSRVHQREYAAVRVGNVYGPRQDLHGEAGVVAIFCERILNKRPLTVYVGDVAQAVWLAATKPLPSPGAVDARAFNIGTGTGTSVLGLAKLLQGIAGSDVPIEFAPHRLGEQQESFVKSDRVRSVLGWSPKMPLAEGLEKTYAWFARKEQEVSA